MTTRTSFLQFAFLIAAAGLLLAAGIGCSSSESTQSSASTSQSSPSETGPSLSLLYTTAENEVVLHDAQNDTSQTLIPEAEPKTARSVSPSGRHLAFSYATTDSSHLALLDLTTRDLQRVHATSGTVTYSLAWHPDQDKLAFGHYRPTENGKRGTGGIQVATPDGPTEDVGCSAAREVLHWLSDRSLATRTDDNLYIVNPEDCATQASLDARRMHLIHYAPDGQQMAYIHRELTYDRSVGEYVPDSSLVLSGPRGENRETLFDDKRQVRHLRWSPDGSELAFDVQAEESGHRQIVVYNGSRPSFLTSPKETTADQTHPRWSPSGSRLAFTLRTSTERYAAVRVKGQTRRLGPTRGSVWGWLDDQSMVVPGPDSVRVLPLTGPPRFAHPTPATLLHVWSRPLS